MGNRMREGIDYCPQCHRAPAKQTSGHYVEYVCCDPEYKCVNRGKVVGRILGPWPWPKSPQIVVLSVPGEYD